MRKIVKMCLFFLLLSSCAPSPEAIQKALTQTQSAIPTPSPTPTPTPVPLSEIDLSSILLIDGDLPTGFLSEPISYENNSDDEARGVVRRIHQEFSKENEGLGSVTVFIFNDLVERDTAFNNDMNSLYSTIKNAVSATKISVVEDIGEKAQLIVGSNSFMGIEINASYIGFVRCHAFIFIGKTMDDSSEIRAYATKLDARLKDIVCR